MKNSKLYIFDKIYLDSTVPVGHVKLWTRLLWVGVFIIFYKILSSINIIGLEQDEFDLYNFMRQIVGGKGGSYLAVGTSGLMVSSMIMQAFISLRIIEVKYGDKKFKKTYQIYRKSFYFLVSIFYGALSAGTSLNSIKEELESINPWWVFILFFLQFFFGMWLFYTMDDVINNWGLGGSITCVIIVDFCSNFFSGLFGYFPDEIFRNTNGFIINFIINCYHYNVYFSAKEGTRSLMRLFIYDINSLLSITITTLLIYYSVYLCLSKFNLSISPVHTKGLISNYPLPIMHTYNTPLIILSVFPATLGTLINVYNYFFPNGGYLGSYFKIFVNQSAGGRDTGFFSDIEYPTSLFKIFYVKDKEVFYFCLLKIYVYCVYYILGGTLVSKIWYSFGGQSHVDTAKKLMDSKIKLVGLRYDKRVIEKELKKYLVPLAFLSGFLSGAIAFVSTILQLMFQITGISILLAISGIIGIIEELTSKKYKEMFPQLKSII